MSVTITSDAINPWQLLESYQHSRADLAGHYGATAVFIGTMRDFNDDQSVTGMFLEHYPGMTDTYLQDLVERARKEWSLLDVLLVHRVGEIRPNDTIVVVATWTAHRAHAYAANRFLMEELKQRAPFWKKEQLASGTSRWVEKNTPGSV